MFDLDKAIAEWRKQMLAAGIKAPVPLDELEIHLREEVEQQVRSGLSAREAFETAAQRMGQASRLKVEFKKVEKVKPVLQQKGLWVLIGVALLSCWLEFGHSPALALIYGFLLIGLVVATFVDFQH